MKNSLRIERDLMRGLALVRRAMDAQRRESARMDAAHHELCATGQRAAELATIRRETKK